METRVFPCILVAVGLAPRASAAAAVPVPSPGEDLEGTRSSEAERGVLPPEKTRVGRVESRDGFIFHPSAPEAGGFRFAIGGLYDAVDPQVMYGFQLRVPQITLDARFGLGAAWSIKAHFNSMFITNELLAGPAVAGRVGRWSFEGAASVGVYFGKLGQLNFDAALIAPQYRPELTVGYDLGDIALSLRGSLLLMGPEQARVGEIWGGLDNSNLFVGHSEMIYVENTTSAGVWYFGAGAMTTRAYYQFWLLFPDSPALYTYARTVAGYEF